MPQKTIVDGNTHDWFKQRQRELGTIEDAPSIAPEPYAYENGTPFAPATSDDHPLVPDRGFDGPG